MPSGPSPGERATTALRNLPPDLAAVVALVVLADLVVLLPGLRETVLRVVLGLPLVFFLPGYALVAALFPEAGDAETAGADAPESSGTGGGIDDIERVALSVGASVAVVPLVGLFLNFTPWGIRLLPVLLSVSGLAVGGAAVAALRRRRLAPERRFVVPYREWLEALRADLFPRRRSAAVLNVALAASVLLALGSVGYAVSVPNQGESFTEFYILTEDENGTLVATDYPTEFVRGQARPVVLGVENHERRPVEYTVVVELQRYAVENASATVLEQRELDRFEVTIANNETWTAERAVTPTMTGERLRLAFLLYAGDPPADPTVNNAYRAVHLLVNVSSDERSPRLSGA